jgi:pyruvate dehydrogenase E2 component (dihydrolipoamide acetyltransferase)
MTLSKQTIPHFYLTRWVDVTTALARREEWNEGRKKADQVSINDLALLAVARGLKAYPQFNGYFQEDRFQPQPAINLGVAIALPEGLIAPAILDCGALSLDEIAACSRDLAERARGGRLKASEYTGATFTVSNLGMFQIDTFTAIIVPPQVGILAVGTVRQVWEPIEGEMSPQKKMALTLSADHRATDGADGARFLGEIVAGLEDPGRLFG